jgi:predicted amidophosphoribosyltransferase
MRCPRCQHDNPPRMKFCGECAAPLASVCAVCGAATQPRTSSAVSAPLRSGHRRMGMRSWLEKAKAEMDEGSR